jgi:hypothetical protein
MSIEYDSSVFFHEDGTIGYLEKDSSFFNHTIWSNIVLAYSTGHLTHESDKLVALSGDARWMH